MLFLTFYVFGFGSPKVLQKFPIFLLLLLLIIIINRERAETPRTGCQRCPRPAHHEGSAIEVVAGPARVPGVDGEVVQTVVARGVELAPAAAAPRGCGRQGGQRGTTLRRGSTDCTHW